MSEKQNNVKYPPPNKRCCIHCHFLSSTNSASTKNPVPMGEREIYKNFEKKSIGNDEFGKGHLCCYKDFWNSENFQDGEDRSFRSFIFTDRGETCFFYPYIEDMELPAAEELERREADRREAKKDRRIAKWSIIVGAVIGVIGIVVGLIIALSSQ